MKGTPGRAKSRFSCDVSQCFRFHEGLIACQMHNLVQVTNEDEDEDEAQPEIGSLSSVSGLLRATVALTMRHAGLFERNSAVCVICSLLSCSSFD